MPEEGGAMPMRQRVVEEVAGTFAALGHPTRLRILSLLRERERDPSELASTLDVAPSGISQHLALLRAHHLVTASREGTRLHYALRDPRVGELLDRGLDLLAGDVADAREVGKAIRLVRRGRV
jgi:ArsR family transcriptional regulator